MTRSLALQLVKWRANPAARGVDVEDPKYVELLKTTIAGNPYLQWIYADRYRRLMTSVAEARRTRLPIVEIGCGPGHFEKFVPEVIKTDVVLHQGVHRLVDAHVLPFENESLGGLFLTNVLHHVREPQYFLAEAERCLVPGGRLTLIEPSNSWLQKTITNLTSPHEYSDDSVTGWSNQVHGRLSHANNALPWILFVRDRAILERRFPRLEILSIRYHTLFAFYISGGYHYRPFLPSWCLPLVKVVEWLGRPLCRMLGFEMLIEVRRRE